MAKPKRPDRAPAPEKGTALSTIPETRDAREAIDTALLAGLIGVPAGENADEYVRKFLAIGKPAGLRAAAAMLKKPDRHASDLLHHRARVVFRDSAALLVPQYFDELQNEKPNPARLDGIWRALKGAGVVVEALPVSQGEKDQHDAASMAIAGKTREELAKSVLDKIRASQGESKA